jgi:hypothetical protein
VDGQLPLVWRTLLARPHQCPERLRRTLDDARGDPMPTHRWTPAARVREAARLAHADMRAPRATDFPPAADLPAEQQRVYEAGAAGYLLLFDEPARAIDVASEPIVFGDVGVRVAAGRELVVETPTGGVELRRLQLGGRDPVIDDGTLRHVALVAPEWSPTPASVRVVVADLITLAVADADVNLAAARDGAVEWLRDRYAALQRAAMGKARPGDHCLDCEHVWSCPIHRSARTA